MGRRNKGGILDARRRVGGRTAILVCLDGIMGVGCVCVCGSREGVLLHLHTTVLRVCMCWANVICDPHVYVVCTVLEAGG